MIDTIMDSMLAGFSAQTHNIFNTTALACVHDGDWLDFLACGIGFFKILSEIMGYLCFLP
jgi:hypothetical protein